MKAKTIIPTLKYKDAKQAITWLCDVLSFSEHLVVPGEGDLIAHAQLKMGDCMIMLGSAGVENEYSKLIKMPAEVDGFQTQSPYIVLSDEDLLTT